MEIGYYPGCTLKTRAKNLEDAAIASLGVFGVELKELPRWNCCGAVYSLTEDDLIHQIAPVRDLVRAMEQGHDTVLTLCSMCYNTLARANLLMREDEEKRKTINDFMDEEPDYGGQVNVVHYLEFLRDHIGWTALREKVKYPLNGLRVAPYYGCTLVRPREVSLEVEGQQQLFASFLQALGAEVAPFSAAEDCCGSYQILGNPDAATSCSGKILHSAVRGGAELMVLSCPLCEYNLGRRQDAIIEAYEADASLPQLKSIPTLYFTQLLALSLGLGADVCQLDLNIPSARSLVEQRFPGAAGAVSGSVAAG